MTGSASECVFVCVWVRRLTRVRQVVCAFVAGREAMTLVRSSITIWPQRVGFT